VVLAGDRLVRRLNREWRGLDRTTDVLSFLYGLPPMRGARGSGKPRPPSRRRAGITEHTKVGAGGDDAEAPAGGVCGVEEEALIGEVIVSLPRCRAQAQERGVDAGVELARLLIHGVLHVLGHDHETAAERARMASPERTLRAWAGRQGIGPGLLGTRRRGGSS
jgi:probable rRNA maturation factor